MSDELKVKLGLGPPETWNWRFLQAMAHQRGWYRLDWVPRRDLAAVMAIAGRWRLSVRVREDGSVDLIPEGEP